MPMFLAKKNCQNLKKNRQPKCLECLEKEVQNVTHQKHYSNTRKHKYNPCPECSDTESQLVLVDLLMGQVQILTPDNAHVSR